jgi:hypothetical protein
VQLRRFFRAIATHVSPGSVARGDSVRFSPKGGQGVCPWTRCERRDTTKWDTRWEVAPEERLDFLSETALDLTDHWDGLDCLASECRDRADMRSALAAWAC